MYIHIGDDVAVVEEDISMILNLETVLPSQKDVTNYINAEDDANRLQYLTTDIPKSLVITKYRTYISSLSTSVIQKRLNSSMGYVNFDENLSD